MASTDDQLRLQGVKEGWVGALDQELNCPNNQPFFLSSFALAEPSCLSASLARVELYSSFPSLHLPILRNEFNNKLQKN